MNNFDRVILGTLTSIVGVIVIFCIALLIFVLEAHQQDQLDAIVRTDKDCYLPCKCAKYYNLGTKQWMDCMQVGEK